jgi:hypothetical protein
MEPRESSTTKTGDGGDANLDAFAELPDGRCLCLECASTAVICTRKDAPPLYDDVCAFMEKVGLGVGSACSRSGSCGRWCTTTPGIGCLRNHPKAEAPVVGIAQTLPAGGATSSGRSPASVTRDLERWSAWWARG